MSLSMTYYLLCILFEIWFALDFHLWTSCQCKNAILKKVKTGNLCKINGLELLSCEGVFNLLALIIMKVLTVSGSIDWMF